MLKYIEFGVSHMEGMVNPVYVFIFLDALTIVLIF